MATTTVTVDHTNIIINGLPLDQLLEQVYRKGRLDAGQEDLTENVTFIALAEELSAKGRKITARTLTTRAKEANVKIFRFDGNRFAVKRKDIKHFVGE